MSEALEDTEAAARLVAFALQRPRRLSKDPDHASLLERYRSDGAFRDHVATVASGLHLLVLGDTEQGLVLAAEDVGPFSVRLSDYRRAGLSVEERLCHGLIQLTIAAWCFPTARSLEDPDSVAGARIAVRKLVDYVVGLCRELEARSTEDPDASSPELQEAWRSVLSRAETRTTPDGRRSPGTLAGMVAHALEFLETGGLLRRISDEDGGTWQALAAYRLQVRELAAHDAAVHVREAAAAVPREDG